MGIILVLTFSDNFDGGTSLGGDKRASPLERLCMWAASAAKIARACQGFEKSRRKRHEQ